MPECSTCYFWEHCSQTCQNEASDAYGEQTDAGDDCPEWKENKSQTGS